MTTSRTQKNTSLSGWHRADIKAALEKAGWSFASLSVHHGYDRRMTQQVLYRPYPKAEKLIADAIGVPPSDIWPSRYDEYGQPIRPPRGRPRGKRRPKKDTTAPTNRNAQKEAL